MIKPSQSALVGHGLTTRHTSARRRLFNDSSPAKTGGVDLEEGSSMAEDHNTTVDHRA